MDDEKQFWFEQKYQSDPEFIYWGRYNIFGHDFTKVVINLEKMQMCLQSDPSNILYLARVERGSEPPIENTDSDGSTLLKRKVSSARLMEQLQNQY